MAKTGTTMYALFQIVTLESMSSMYANIHDPHVVYLDQVPDVSTET